MGCPDITDPLRSMTLVDQSMNLRNVHPQATPGGNPHAASIGSERAVGEHTFEQGEGPPETRARMSPLLPGVQELGQIFAAMTLSRHGEIYEESHHFPALHVDGNAVLLENGRTKKMQHQFRYSHVTFSYTALTGDRFEASTRVYQNVKKYTNPITLK